MELRLFCRLLTGLWGKCIQPDQLCCFTLKILSFLSKEFQSLSLSIKVCRMKVGKYTHTTCVFWFGKTFPFSGKFNFRFLSSQLESQERLESIQASLHIKYVCKCRIVETMYTVQLYTMTQCKTHVHVMVLYNFEVKGKGIQRIKRTL